IEELARDARYGVFERLLEPGHWLLLAHHADDQLETLMFRLLRGTGLRGLAGMPRRRPVGAGQLLRPLLPWSRRQLEDWARSQQLDWIEDPANADPRYARTALRHELLPQLRQRWPSMPDSLLRLAEHAAEANELLDERASDDLQAACGGVTDDWLRCWPSLDLGVLAAFSPARQKNLLRYWLHQHAIRLPDQRHLHSLVEQLERSWTQGRYRADALGPCPRDRAPGRRLVHRLSQRRRADQAARPPDPEPERSVPAGRQSRRAAPGGALAILRRAHGIRGGP